MLGARGLYGHIQNNAMKSAGLLSGFTVLMCLSWYAWCVVYAAVVHAWWPQMLKGRRHRASFDISNVVDIFDKALDVALFNWWVPLFLAAMWFAVAFSLHANMIRLATGARPVTRKEQPKLYNMVENLAITAGLPMPRIEVIRTGALNAYASGLGPADAVIVVTSELMKALTDEELEAVLAHEMTHIKNHDVRLMVVASCFAGGLTLLGDGVARWLFPPQRNYDDLHHTYQYDYDHNPGANRRAAAAEGLLEAEAAAPIAVVISLLIAVVFFAMAHVSALLINFAISRAREFMADAGAVELTKNPDALISALNKISGNDEIPGLNVNVKAMMISASIDGFFATHPPIETRVMALQQYAGGRVVDRAPRRAASATSVTAQAMALPAGALGISGGRATFGRKRAVNG
jgi:heat shock protein HtpX